MPEHEVDLRRRGWTRRVLLAVVPSAWAAAWLMPAPAEAEELGPRPRLVKENVFEAGVFEDDVFE